MGFGEKCGECGANLLPDQAFCTSCGSVVARQNPAPLEAPEAPDSSPRRRVWSILAASGGLVAALAVGGGLVWATSGSGQDSDPASAVVTPSGAPRTPQAVPANTANPNPQDPAPIVTVTETATQTAAVPGPTETVYLESESNDESSAQSATSGTIFAGDWSGSITGDYSDYRVVLDLDESISGWVSGTVTSTNVREGVTGVWYASGTASGNRVVLTPDDWISRPNNTWQRDTVTLTYNGGTLTASFVDPREPNKVWGSTTLS